MSVLPSRLAAFFIYNPTLGNEETEHEKLMYYHPPEEDLNTKLDFVGMSEALVGFSCEFSPQKPCHAVHTGKHRYAIFPCEPDHYIVMIIKSPAMLRDGTEVNSDELDSNLDDDVLQAILRRFYALFCLFNGSFADVVAREGLPTLKLRLQLLVSHYIHTIEFDRLPFFIDIQGFRFLPVDRACFLTIQFLLASISAQFPSITTGALMYGGKLIWSGLPQADMYRLYSLELDPKLWLYSYANANAALQPLPPCVKPGKKKKKPKPMVEKEREGMESKTPMVDLQEGIPEGDRLGSEVVAAMYAAEASNKSPDASSPTSSLSSSPHPSSSTDPGPNPPINISASITPIPFFTPTESDGTTVPPAGFRTGPKRVGAATSIPLPSDLTTSVSTSSLTPPSTTQSTSDSSTASPTLTSSVASSLNDSSSTLNVFRTPRVYITTPTSSSSSTSPSSSSSLADDAKSRLVAAEEAARQHGVDLAKVLPGAITSQSLSVVSSPSPSLPSPSLSQPIADGSTSSQYLIVYSCAGVTLILLAREPGAPLSTATPLSSSSTSSTGPSVSPAVPPTKNPTVTSLGSNLVHSYDRAERGDYQPALPSGSVAFSPDFYAELEGYISTNITKLSDLLRDQAQPQGTGSGNQEVRFLYFNNMNLAMKTTWNPHQSPLTAATVRTIRQIHADFAAAAAQTQSQGTRQLFLTPEGTLPFPRDSADDALEASSSSPSSASASSSDPSSSSDSSVTSSTPGPLSSLTGNALTSAARVTVSSTLEALIKRAQHAPALSTTAPLEVCVRTRSNGWIVGRRATESSREFFVLFDDAAHTLMDVQTEVDKLTETNFANIFIY